MIKKIFYGFFVNLAEVWKGYNLAFQGLAILLTYIIVASDFDWKYFEMTRKISPLFYFPAIILGGTLPIIIPLFLLWYGKTKRNENISFAGYALGQSAIMGSLVTTFYKIFTGRIQPSLINNTIDISKKFNFGFMRNGIVWGWPSSHTTIAFAMATTIFYLYPKKKILLFFVFAYALYVGLSVSVSIHWFSEFIAGIIFGIIIGRIIGKSFAGYKQKISG